MKKFKNAATSKPKHTKPWSKRRKIITWSILGVVTLLLVVLGYYVVRIVNNSSQVFDGNATDVLQKEPLQKDASGRSNILIFGTSEGAVGHKGALLADSIMVLSIDQETNESYTVSIPRDLWVKYDVPCSVGDAGKINAVYMCSLEANGNDQRKASLAFANKVSEVVGTDVQYFLAINYSALKEIVNSLGGIEVTIASDDPRGIYDTATNLRLSNGTHFINGETALKLSKARNSEGGYGLSQSNFDREKNQQLVLRAIQERALKTGTLLSPAKIVELTEALDGNIRTNVKGSELRTALEVAQGVQSSAIASKPLNAADSPLVVTDTRNGQSIVRPAAGLYDYTAIHEYLRP